MEESTLLLDGLMNYFLGNRDAIGWVLSWAESFMRPGQQLVGLFQDRYSGYTVAFSVHVYTNGTPGFGSRVIM